MSLSNMILLATVAAFSGLGVHALPTEVQERAPISFVTINEYSSGGCVPPAFATNVAIPGNNTCTVLSPGAKSVKVTQYAEAGCQADFFLDTKCGNGCGTCGTYGQLNNCEQGNSNFQSVFVRCI